MMAPVGPKRGDGMFYADLNLERFSLAGLEALDVCRRLRLPDAATLATDTQGDFVRRTVSEGFARRHAGYQSNNCLNFHIDLGLLVPGDVTVTHRGFVAIAREMSEERFHELCAAARVGRPFCCG